MITDNSYFEKGTLYIPNNKDVSARPEGTPSKQSEIDFFIETYERELLLNAFGTTIYNELVIAYSDLDNASQKWQDLINGVDYTINGKLHKWEGLKGFNKQSLIANYIFCAYLRNDEQIYTTVGVVKSTAENAVLSDATPKFIKSWNSFIEKYQSTTNGSPEIIVNGSGAVGLDYYGNKSSIVSLYQFLTDANELDATAFPNFEFRFYQPYNSFGI